MAALNLFLLGGFELCSSAGTPVTVAAKRAKALLAYLAVSAGRAHPRDKLAGLLWEEREEAQARHNLRQVLASLRRSLPEVDRVLLADSETLALRREGITEGIAQMREGLRKWQAVGAGLNWPYFLALLAGAYGRAGRTDEGLRCLEEALGRVAANGERLYEAELYRLQGELLHKVGPGGPHSPEACFEKAIEVARRQGAVLWELRARIGLCRLWQKQGRVPEAQHLLAAIYGRFNEGFDTQDLQEAQTLLIDLGDKCLNGSNFS